MPTKSCAPLIVMVFAMGFYSPATAEEPTLEAVRSFLTAAQSRVLSISYEAYIEEWIPKNMMGNDEDLIQKKTEKFIRDNRNRVRRESDEHGLSEGKFLPYPSKTIELYNGEEHIRVSVMPESKSVILEPGEKYNPDTLQNLLSYSCPYRLTGYLADAIEGKGTATVATDFDGSRELWLIALTRPPVATSDLVETYKVWIDFSKSYFVPRWQIILSGASTGPYIYFDVITEGAREIIPGVWLPIQASWYCMPRSLNKSKPGEIPSSKLKVLSVAVNGEIRDELFPCGDTFLERPSDSILAVSDTRSGRSISYRLDQNGKPQ